MKEISLNELLKAKKELELTITSLIRQFESDYSIKIYNVYYIPEPMTFSTNKREKTIQISLDI